MFTKKVNVREIVKERAMQLQNCFKDARFTWISHFNKRLSKVLESDFHPASLF